MKSITFSVRRPVTVAMVTVAVVLFGLVSLQRLPLTLLPELSYPSLTVETKFPGAAPGEVETLVTRPLEEAVGILSGVRRISSRSRPGLSQVTLEFAWGRDMSLASLDVRQKVDLVTLPKEAEKPAILRFDPSTEPVLRLYLTAPEGAAVDEAALYRLRYVAEELLKKDLESVEGVAAVKVNGGLEEEIQVRLDEGKVAALGLRPAEIQAALARENVNRAGGSLYEDEARYLVRANNEFQNLDHILATIVAAREGRLVRIGDVATVARGHRQREVVTRFRGPEAVELALYKEGDANTVRVARAVRARLEAVKKDLPAGLTVGTASDQSRFIESAVGEVMSNALVGGLLAMVVLFLFLKDARSTLIIGLTIPISIVATFFFMYRLGVSLNVMSLGGLALGVGMLVDNAVVVLEAIVRRREQGEPALEAAMRGAQEVGSALVGVTLTTVAVFLPVVFVEGFAAQLFKDQALTVSISILVSLVVALTLIPMVAARSGARAARAVPPPAAAPAPLTRWGRLRGGLRRSPAFVLRQVRRGLGLAGRALARAGRPLTRAFDRALGRVLEGYPVLLEKALDRPGLVLGTAVALLLLSLGSAFLLEVDLVPALSQGEFSCQVELPEGTPLALTDRALSSALAELKGDPAVESFSSVAGGAGLSLTSTGTEGENFGQIDVRLEPGRSPEDEAAVMGRLRTALERVPQARLTFQRPSLFSFRTPVEVEAYADDLGALTAAAERLESRMRGLSGLVDVRSSAEMGNPELQIRFDRDALARLGLQLDAVAATVRGKVRGEVATRFNQGDREIDILVRSSARQEVGVDEVSRVIVDTRDGTPVYLSSVATVSREMGPSEIRRIGQKRAAVVTANLDGVALGEAAEAVRAVLRDEPLAAGVVARLSGQEEERARSFGSLTLALWLSLFLVYLVMAAEFESFVHPLVIFFTVPLGGVGVVASLLLTGQTVNVVVLIGIVMLGGIVVDNAIVLIECVKQLREEGLSPRDALIQGGRRRLRPILMTTATTALGLLPMALGLGEGAELRQPLAITVIGGLLLSTLLTLVVIPVTYLVVERGPARARAAVPEGSPALPAAPAEAP